MRKLFEFFLLVADKRLMKMIFNRLKLAQKLTLLTLSISVIGFLVTIGGVYHFTLRLNTEFLDAEIIERENIIKKTFIEPLWSFDNHQVEEVTKSLISDNHLSFIRAVRVLDPSGQLIFTHAYSKDELGLFKNYSKHPFTRLRVTKIVKDDQVLGTVEFIFSAEGIINSYRGMVKRIFLFAFAMIVLTSFGINLFFKRLLTHPLNRLLFQIKEFKQERFEGQSYEDLSGELRDIGNALNYASFTIKKRNEDLKHHSENLEKMVEERTVELHEQTLKNINSSRLVAVGEVASGIAHEINNPLTVINGQMLKLQRTLMSLSNDESVLAPIEKINLMSMRIVKIINGLKMISRDGQLDPMINFDLRNLIEEIKLLTEMKIKALNINFSITIPEEAVSICAREVQISQVLVNLINNAVDAISSLDDKWIKVRITSREGLVEFRISDSGRGISADVQAKIMTPFFTTKGVGKGTGLGLSISKGIITEHGGELYYNEASENTEFIFTLPLAESKRQVA